MYQAFFGFHTPPFALTPNTALFHALPPHYEALNTVLSAVKMGEGVVKVTGEVGTGKTMVCRMLLNQFSSDTGLIYLPNPAASGEALYRLIAHDLGVEAHSTNDLVNVIQEKLLALSAMGQHVVALLDEAQAMSDEALESLRLLGNLETEDRKLLQIVLFGQPELDERLASHHMRQLRQRITFNARLRPLSLSEGCAYIQYRIKESGGSEALFPLSQRKAIWKAAKGIPRLVNQICHKTLLLAYSSSSNKINNRHIYEAIYDTYDAVKPRHYKPYFWGWNKQ